MIVNKVQMPREKEKSGVKIQPKTCQRAPYNVTDRVYVRTETKIKTINLEQ